MEEMLARPSCSLYLPLGQCKSSFDLEKAVCNHGFFMMPPNKWISSIKTLRRPLRLADLSSSVIVSVSHPAHDASTLHVCVHGTQALSLPDQQAILVSRMLRITYKDEITLKEFHKLHPTAKDDGFGRIFRSPSLFEDAVKSILLCNCAWGRTLKMAESLCELQAQLSSGSLILESNGVRGSKRKRRRENKATSKINDKCLNRASQPFGNFPSSKELASFNEIDLNRHCSLGYRASYIIKFARLIERGALSLSKLEEECDLSYEEVHHKLSKIKGFGPFTIASILMCLGCYQIVPADTETVRHLKEVHGRTGCNKKTISKDVEEIYRGYAPFQCIAYWFELIGYYEKRYGKLSELSESDYHMITGSADNLRKGNGHSKSDGALKKDWINASES